MNRFRLIHFLIYAVFLSPAIGQESTYPNIRYSEEFERSTLNLWLPDSEEPTPLVVYFHGGGLRGGDKGRIQFKEDFLALPERGVAFASVGYPLMGDLKERKGLSEMDKRLLIYDQTFQAIEFLKKYAADYNLDAERIALSGSSAGTGISNYLTYVKKAGITACIGIQQARGASHYTQYIEKDSPTLILYTSSGPEDKVHSPSNARLLKDHCDRVDSPCFIFGSPKSGLPAVPDGKRFVSHAVSLIDSIWSSKQE